MKRILFLFPLLFYQLEIFSQEIPSIPDKLELKVRSLRDTASRHAISLQLHGGTQGVGADFRYGIGKTLSVRFGASAILPIKIEDAFKISDFNSKNNLKADLSNIHLLADYVPFKKVPGFRLVGGAGYLFKGKGSLNVIPIGDYKFGDIQLTAEQVGVVDFDISWKGFAPYIGMGILKSFPKRRFNINFDLGTYYLTAPKATVVGTGMLSDNDSQSALITSNVSDYRWLPVVQLNFNFRIK